MDEALFWPTLSWEDQGIVHVGEGLFTCHHLKLDTISSFDVSFRLIFPLSQSAFSDWIVLTGGVSCKLTLIQKHIQNSIFTRIVLRNPVCVGCVIFCYYRKLFFCVRWILEVSSAFESPQNITERILHSICVYPSTIAPLACSLWKWWLVSRFLSCHSPLLPAEGAPTSY